MQAPCELNTTNKTNNKDCIRSLLIMNSQTDQWLAELENEELDLVGHLSMQQLAESLANELWDQPQERRDQQQQLTPSPTGFSFAGDVNNTEGFPIAVSAGNSSMFSFTDGSASSLNFSALEDAAAGNYCLLPSEKRSGRRAISSVQEHVISERKRREKMHHQFATLASIIPDITKTDKVSLLESAIQYVHKLEGKVKALKEHQNMENTAESLMFDTRYCIGTGDGEDGGVDETEASSVSPKIEADVRGTTVLLRITCREKKGVLIMVLTELEKHGLSIMNTSVVPFGDDSSSLNITITAEIEENSCTTGELVKNLNLALRNEFLGENSSEKNIDIVQMEVV